MTDHFADRLLSAIERKGSPICVGIDPVYEMLPDAVAGSAGERDPHDVEACVDAIYAFTTKVLDVIRPHVPCVKFQSAYFEKYLWEGVQAYYELIHEAKEMGFLVIGDVKRGDIGATSEAYAAAHLSEIDFAGIDEAATPDAITINPLLGIDSIEPFVNVARETGKGLFVLVRTSNPGSADLQDAKTIDGRTFSEMLADRLQPVAAAPGLVGRSGWSALGAVVGATQPHTMASLRQRLPKSIFLLPGYGTQGATADMTRAAFRDGKGAIVSASRSILYAHHKAPTQAWDAAVLAAVQRMREELAFVS
jgi:orotidine-5'-phosphate decarboxylase